MLDNWMIALILVIVVIGIYGIGVIVYDMTHFKIATYEIRSEKIDKPYSLVMLSDLHNHSYGKANRRLTKAVNEIDVDCVVCAGDLFTSKPPGNYTHAVELLQGIKHKPIFVVNGNHETKVNVYRKLFGDCYDRYSKRVNELGATDINNQHYQIPNTNIDLCGVVIGLEFFKHFRQRKMPDDYIGELVGDANPELFTILVAHHPNYFANYEKWGADLVLSGHIHGGIIKLPFLGGVISPTVELFPKYDGGLFRIGNSNMILGRGLGSHTLPIRMWNPGEIVLVRLLPKEG